MMFKINRDVRGGVVDDYVCVGGHSVGVRSLGRNKFRKVFVADTGLAKVDHSGPVSSLNQVHLGQESKSGPQAMASGVDRVAGVEVFEASDFDQHIWKNVSLRLLEAAVHRAAFTLRVGLPVNPDNPNIGDEILKVRGASKNHVDRFWWG